MRVAPKVAASGVLTNTAIATKRKIVSARLNTSAPPATRSTSAAPTTASSTLPVATSIDEATWPVVVV